MLDNDKDQDADIWQDQSEPDMSTVNDQARYIERVKKVQYRDGFDKGESELLQEGFNAGFKLGRQLGSQIKYDDHQNHLHQDFIQQAAQKAFGDEIADKAANA